MFSSNHGKFDNFVSFSLFDLKDIYLLSILLLKKKDDL